MINSIHTLFFTCTLWIYLFSFLHAAEFVVVIPSYNNKAWYKKNLDSVFSQDYADYRILFIDDASPDGTGPLVKEYIQEKGFADRVTLIQNDTRCGSLANLYQAIWKCDPKEIVVQLDGDDFFKDEKVLSRLHAIYSDPNVWVTYGQFEYYPAWSPGWAAQVPIEVIVTNTFREYHWVTTALRTFYAALFQKINKDDLLFDGDFFQMSGDLAYMFPVVEMAGLHSRFIPEVLYVYNVATSINDGVRDPQRQKELGWVIRDRPKYSPLKELFPKAKKTIYITPGQTVDLFAVNNPVFNRDNGLEKFCRLRDALAAEGYDLVQTHTLDGLKDFEYLIVSEIPVDQLEKIKQYPKEKLILILWEPPSVSPQDHNPEFHEPFSKVFTWRDDLVNDTKYFKFYYPDLHPMISDPIAFESKKLCTMIACNKSSSNPNELYTERLKVIQFFENSKILDFDLYGKFWPSPLKTYKGPIEKKVDILKAYKFCFAYENIKGVPGYVTEKIFDCFQAGCVPIYWGAPNVTAYIPKECFIAREDFDSNEALYNYLKNMDKARYDEYINHIQAYLKSDKAQLYSIDNFVKIVMDTITQVPNKQ